MTLQHRQPLVAEILGWPPAERGDLAAKLLDSLDGGEDTGVEEAWAEEIHSRIREMESGQAGMTSWAEARKQILADDDGD